MSHEPATDFINSDTGMDLEMSRSESSSSLKRPASPSFEEQHEETSPKRLRGDMTCGTNNDTLEQGISTDNEALVEDLAQELQCGCCSELVYKPVIVNPCQHFFCGSCCALWIRNGGTNCPACRGISTSVVPSRPLQSIIDALLRNAPSKTRAESERKQADEIYRSGATMRIPTPREASPEPNLNQGGGEFARPCPHCVAGNPFGWRCPQPIPDPNTDPEHAWSYEDGTPPGHAYCGNCENLLAVRAPTTTLCDMCRVSFCGIGVQGRCLAVPLLSQHPHALSDLADLIQSTEIYECFDSNTVEVDIMLDYLTAQGLSPRHIYREIVTHVQSQPRGFAPLMELDLFVDVHGVAASPDPGPDAPRTRICRLCAAEVFLWGLREWWVRERQKGYLDENVLSRKDCSEGSGCGRQKDLSHAREFNHIIAPRIELEAPPPQVPAELPSEVPQMPPPSLPVSPILPSTRLDSPIVEPSASSPDIRDVIDAML